MILYDDIVWFSPRSTSSFRCEHGKTTQNKGFFIFVFLLEEKDVPQLCLAEFYPISVYSQLVMQPGEWDLCNGISPLPG